MAVTVTAQNALKCSWPTAFSAAGHEIITAFSTAGGKTTPHSRRKRRPVVLEATVSPLEGPAFSFPRCCPVLSHRKVRAGRGCMAVMSDLGATNLCSRRDPGTYTWTAVGSLSPAVVGAVRLGSALPSLSGSRVTAETPYAVQCSQSIGGL